MYRDQLIKSGDARYSSQKFIIRACSKNRFLDKYKGFR